MERVEILRILDIYSNEDEATKKRIANAILDLSNVVVRSEQLNTAWKVLERVGFERGNEFTDDDIAEMLCI